MSRRGPSASDLVNLGERQAELNELRFHYLQAALLQQYQIAARPSGPRNLYQVTFDGYEARNLEPVEADRDHRRSLRGYVDAVNRMMTSNHKMVEGGVLYVVVKAQFWSLMDYYHSNGTTGRDDWDTLFGALLAEPRRDIIPCEVCLITSRALSSPN